MLAQVSQVTRRPRGGVSLRPSTVTADSLRFGRGTDNEVLLQDVRVGLAEAELQRRDGALYLSQTGTNPVRLNGAPVAASPVKVGDEIQIGPFKITVVEPPAGTDVAVTVELVDPLGDDFARLQGQSRIGLEHTWLSRRNGAWAGALIVLILFLALPIFGYAVNPKPDPRAATPPSRIVPAAVDSTWDVGEISNPHKTFAVECRACHQTAFIQVRDAACLTCHSKLTHHVDPKRFPTMANDSSPCTDCHQEHHGARGVIIRAQSLCTDCHADLKRKAPTAELRNVTDFGRDHPQFAITLVADAAADTPDKKFRRVVLGGADKPVDKPNMKFSHRAHLPTGAPGEPVAWPSYWRKLDCADCHQVAPGGGLMQPISFAKHCAECHNGALRFDKQWKSGVMTEADAKAAASPAVDAPPPAIVPHGDAAVAQRMIGDYYARIVLIGGVKDGQVPGDVPEVARRRPGTPLTEPQRVQALEWARARADEASKLLFNQRACGTCHEITGEGDTVKIAPLLMETHFFPKAEFNHAKHATVACDSCHKDARVSTASSEVLVPGIENCRTCHGGQAASAKVPSTCITCHGFHNPGTGPLGQQTASSEKK